MNVGNYGNTFVGGTGYGGDGFDLSAYTGLSLVFIPPGGAEFTVESPDVVLGATPYLLPNGNTFDTGQYVTYIFLEDQISVAGMWRVRLIYDNTNLDPPEHFISSIGSFRVGA